MGKAVLNDDELAQRLPSRVGLKVTGEEAGNPTYEKRSWAPRARALSRVTSPRSFRAFAFTKRQMAQKSLYQECEFARGLPRQSIDQR